MATVTIYCIKINTFAVTDIESKGRCTINYNGLTIKNTNYVDLLPKKLNIIPPIIRYINNV